MEKAIRICWILTVLNLLAAVTALLTWGGGPVPVHFGFDGSVNRTAAPVVGFLSIPTIAGAVLLVTVFAVRSEPGRRNLEHSAKLFCVVLVGSFIVLAAGEAAIIAAAHGAANVASLIPVMVGLLLMAVGNFLPKSQRNFTLGIRNRWTLSSDAVWRRTHRFAGPLMMAAGALCAVTPWITPSSRQAGALLTSILLLAALLPSAYSYYAWLQEGRPRLN